MASIVIHEAPAEVVHTEIEDVEPIGDEQTIADVQQTVQPEDVLQELTRDDVKSDSAELPRGHEVTAMLMEHGGDPRPREEILADLDARDAELERKQADASIPGNWREATGVGRTARTRRS